MKITLNLNDAVLANAKTLSVQERISLATLIEEGLALRLRAARLVAARAPLTLPVFKGRGGLVAGVNPLCNKALLAAAGDGI